MSRYRKIEAAAYQRGIEAASGWLRAFLQAEGTVAAGRGWDADLLLFRIDQSDRIMTCPIIPPHLAEWARRKADA